MNTSGRPRQTDAARRTHSRLHMLLAPDLMLRLQAVAKTRGIPLAQHIRQVLIADLSHRTGLTPEGEIQ